VPSEPEAPTDRFRILSFDGGGILGLISALTVAALEERLEDLSGKPARVADYFHLFSGTSTGGLIALGLTSPTGDGTGEDLASLYRNDGPSIFRNDPVRWATTAGGWLGPTYSPDPLREALEQRFGEATIGEALREVLITSYDMKASEPYFFKRWRAREPGRPDPPFVDAALATAAPPTLFPSHEYGGRVLIDGGVFANNPVVAAIVEALKRKEEIEEGEPPLAPSDLLVVSIGTGEHELEFTQDQVGGWGKCGWIVPQEGTPPLLGAVMGGTTDAPCHWAHVLLNHFPGEDPPGPDNIGRGPRFFRWQAKLAESIGLDDASEENLHTVLPKAAEELIASRAAELDAVAERLVKLGPLPPDPPQP
jgi:hypothetical protein